MLVYFLFSKFYAYSTSTCRYAPEELCFRECTLSVRDSIYCGVPAALYRPVPFDYTVYLALVVFRCSRKFNVM